MTMTQTVTRMMEVGAINVRALMTGAILMIFAILLNTKPISAGDCPNSKVRKFKSLYLGTQSLKFNRSQFMDLTDACSRTGQYEAVINRSHPALMVKLDTR